MTAYPNVLGEFDTIAAVLAGRSLARYGDGEFKMCRGGGIKSQVANGALSARLRDILQDAGECLVGIPNIHSETPKSDFWKKFTRCAELLNPQHSYVSAFVSRPDSAPWIDTPDYWAMVESLWLGRAVTLVRGSSKSLTADDLHGAGEVTEIIAPRQNAWSEYEQLLKRIGRPERALLCLGPTATVMAVDLCVRGVHAIDLGHVGMFVRKHRRGEPMWVTKEDKEATL